MISRYEAIIDGVALSSLDDRLLILDISHASGIENRSVTYAKRDGMFIYDRFVQSASVEIKFELHIYDIAERQLVCQEVARWACGNILQTNDRQNQRLRVICTKMPVIKSAKKWTEELTVAFNSYLIPFWEDELISSKATSDASSLYVSGNVPRSIARANVEVEVVPSATITTITLTCGDTSITLNNISVSASQTLKIDYDENMNLRIKNGSVSYLSKRTGSDDLLAECGASNAISVSADAIVTATFSARGLYL